jgi:hypothetical protein
MLRHFEKLLKLFPYSKLADVGAILRVNAISDSEPALLETMFDQPVDIEAILNLASPLVGSDCAVLVETFWDLWKFDGKDWKVGPVRTTLACFGPAYEKDDPDHLRIEFGVDTHFLPQPKLPDHLVMARSNIRSLLHLVQQIDNALSPDSRALWVETGENFAEKLQEALSATVQEIR